MFSTLARETDDGPFDDAGVDAVAAFGQALMCEVMQQAAQQRRMTGRVGQLKFNQGILHNPQGTHETEPVGVYVGVEGGVVHEGADDVVSNQERVQFLDHAARFEAAQGVIDQPLMHLQFIDPHSPGSWGKCDQFRAASQRSW